MSLLKCKMCGAELTVNDGENIAVCEYCGSKQTIPNVDDEKKMNMFSRANRLRFSCEFDKAASVYESIVANFPEEAEAYWGLVLCKYGIEYVDDPATGSKVPTCHRSSFESIQDDINYEQTLENATPIARTVYRDEARHIEELRKSIVEVSLKEKPYDIFICYKETDENGDRTTDSVMAQDVYTALTEKGYKVFFSRITLEDKLGWEYEPYIFAALNSAKVMLAFGTDYEYYNAVWVKNEWARYLQLISRGERKVLIPCFKGIDAYDMPKEFARLQAQDMGKVGAVQDLLRGIEKILPREKETVKETVRETVAYQNGGGNATSDSLLRRAFMYLEDGDWENADEYCEKVLDIIPECGDAYLGKLMAELRCKKREMLANGTVVYDNNNNYLKAVRFGSEELKKELMEYDVTVKYRKASETLKNSLKKEDFLEAEKMFRLILGYRDADEKAKEASEGWSLRVQEAHDCFSIWKESKIGMENILQSLKNEKIKLESEKSMLEKRIHDYPSIKEKANGLANEKQKLEEEIQALEEKISGLEREKNALGLFSGKQKRELQDRINTLNSELREKVHDHDIRLNPLYNTAKREYENAMNPERCQARITEIDAQTAKITEKIAAEEKRRAEIRMTPAEAEIAIMSERYSGILAEDIGVLREIVNNCKLFDVLAKNDIYKTSMVKAETLLSDLTIRQRAALEMTINLGIYYNQPIEWKILAIERDKALLITKNKICCRRYSPAATSFSYGKYVMTDMITWDKSSLRHWLNNEFYNNTFSQSEKVKILSSTVGNNRNPKYIDEADGGITEDNVFLLSISEVKRYFSSDRDKSIGISWWLRSPGDNCCYRAASVNNDGSVNYYGNYIDDNDVAVRPALWINLNS